MDLVTETDKECEKLIFGRLKEAFPDHNFIGEEESSAQGFTAGLTQAPTWMVDPVDGEDVLPARTHTSDCACCGQHNKMGQCKHQQALVHSYQLVLCPVVSVTQQ